MRIAAGALVTSIAVLAGTQAGLAAPAPTPFPPITAKKTECPKALFKVSGVSRVTVVVAGQKGQHPSSALLTCKSAYAIALAGRRYFLKPPFRTGEKVAGATYTAAVGGPDVWPPTSGPVYGWFGNGIEVLLMIPSGA